MERLKFYNAAVLTPYRIINDGYVLVDNGKIASIGKGDIAAEDYYPINAENMYLSPGFIDIHTHGGGGHDFMDGTAEAYLGAANMHIKHGTTSMVPTTLTSTNKELKKTFEVFKKAKKLNTNGASLLGLHLEGPYFSMEQRGAQDPRYIRNPDYDEYSDILNWSDDIIRWSAAPELPGGMEFGKYVSSKGIVVSIAHSNAIYEQVLDGYENNYTHVTHLYSGMSSVRRINAYRYAGVVESAYLIDDMTVEIIADGAHLPASLLKLIYKIKSADKIALVTDSIRAAGMPEGKTRIGSLDDGQEAIVEDGVAKLPDRSAFAGSVATADRLVRTMVRKAGISLMDVVKMITSTPAKIMKLENKGSIEVGKDADIVLFDKNINIKMAVVNGQIKFRC